MELRQLKYFIAVVEEGTVSGAARALHMSQPPLTAQMHALEAELGCALFEHAGRRLRITEAGRALYARARAIAALCEGANAEPVQCIGNRFVIYRAREKDPKIILP